MRNLLKAQTFAPDGVDPTLEIEFVRQTSLALEIILDDVLVGCELDVVDQAWFRQHADTWVRWFHANDPKWRAWLNGKRKRIDPPSQLLIWFDHWLKAYSLNPDAYQKSHPLEALG